MSTSVDHGGECDVYLPLPFQVIERTRQLGSVCGTTTPDYRSAYV